MIISRKPQYTVCCPAPAIALYKRHGFETEGTHREFAFRGGAFVDAYAMARIKP